MPPGAAAAPREIEKRSFEIIESEIPPPRKYEGGLWEAARRCIHAAGDTSILEDLVLDEEALEKGVEALEKGMPIFTDTRMLAAGLVARRMDRLGVRVIPIMGLPGIEEMAAGLGCTRARAGISLIKERLAGCVIAIGNAPTALLALLEELEGAPKERGPAMIAAMPVGFVNAAESKELLCQSPWPKFTIRGRKGGSAMAAAAVNALAEIALRNKTVPAARKMGL